MPLGEPLPCGTETSNRRASLASKAFWSAAASICNLFARLVVQVIIARMLGPDGVGRIAYMVWLIEIANLLSCFGLPSSLTRYQAELRGQNKQLEARRFEQWVFCRYVVLALLGAVVVGSLFFYSSHYAALPGVLPVLMFLFFARSLETINRADLAGRQRFDLLARINVAAAFVLIISVAVGAYWHGIAGALYGYIVGSSIPALFSFTMLKGYSLQQKVSPALRRRVWKFTFNTWLAMLVSAFVWSRMEIFFLERYWDAREVAMFTVALTFALMVRRVATMFSGAFMAHFSHLVGDGNHELIQRQYETATRLMAFLIIPMAFGGAAIMPALLPLLFGAEFGPAVPNAMVLTATSALAFSLIGSALVYAKERSGFIAVSGFFGAILSVTTGFLIISQYGAWGAVWCKLFVQSSMIVLGTGFIVTRLRFSYPFGGVGKTAIAAGLCAVCAGLIVHLIPHPVVALCLALPVGAGVYFISAKFLRVVRTEDVLQLKRVFGRLPAGVRKYVFVPLDVLGNAG